MYDSIGSGQVLKINSVKPKGLSKILDDRKEGWERSRGSKNWARTFIFCIRDRGFCMYVLPIYSSFLPSIFYTLLPYLCIDKFATSGCIGHMCRIVKVVRYSAPWSCIRLYKDPSMQKMKVLAQFYDPLTLLYGHREFLVPFWFLL